MGKFLAKKESASIENAMTLRAELSALIKRLFELDKLVQYDYEDKVIWHIPENPCIQLLNSYETERNAKQKRRKKLTEQIAARSENEKVVDDWLDIMRDYSQLRRFYQGLALSCFVRIGLTQGFIRPAVLFPLVAQSKT
ncbi:MAG: hypothetical protein LUD44_01540 [Firmicutes bacterium]|nr:hypothetical protein [Bacillota bacterium]